ncbi:MAG: hypothetical protein LC104_07295 [Bacteroidales bacterium]|nr:hypothetical protein [Bacteroidales bacterium]
MHTLLALSLVIIADPRSPADTNEVAERASQAFFDQDHKKAERLWLEAAQLVENDPLRCHDYCNYLAMVGVSLAVQHRYPAAETHFRRSYAVACQHPETGDEARACENLARNLISVGRFEESEVLFRKCWRLSQGHPDRKKERFILLQDLRRLYQAAGRYDDAVACATRLLTQVDQHHDPRAFKKWQHLFLAQIAAARGEFAECERQRVFLDEPGKLRYEGFLSGQVHLAAGRYEAARAAVSHELKTQLEQRYPDAVVIAPMLITRAQALIGLGRKEEALSDIRTVLTMPADCLSPSHPYVADALDVYHQLVPGDQDAIRRRDKIRQERASAKFAGIAVFTDE